MEWYFKVLSKYMVFTGRASRKEFWMFTLFNFLIFFGLFILSLLMGLIGHSAVGAVIYGAYALGIFLPGIAVAVRRLHDSGRSGWWMLVLLIPGIGGIIFLIFMILDSSPGPNAFGEEPRLDLA